MRQDFVGDESSQVEEEKFAGGFNLHRGKGVVSRSKKITDFLGNVPISFPVFFLR